MRFPNRTGFAEKGEKHHNFLKLNGSVPMGVQIFVNCLNRGFCRNELFSQGFMCTENSRHIVMLEISSIRGGAVGKPHIGV